MARVATVLVIACPHALGLAIPLVVAITTAMGASNGVLVRNRLALEEARELDTIIFDKTGTLTRGEFGVVGIATAGDWPEDEALALAAALEGDSEHTIARGIRNSRSNSAGTSCIAAIRRIARDILRKSSGVAVPWRDSRAFASITRRRGLTPSGQAGMQMPQPLHWWLQLSPGSFSGMSCRSSPRSPLTTSGPSSGAAAVNGVTGQTSTHLPQAVQASAMARLSLSR